MASSVDSPASPAGDLDQDDKPRVFVDGPGGADTKQGAKIACLECRSAKIKCSAPTDGQVPCKRCVKHQRECLFEKHKRGRKPNKRFSVPSDLRAGRNGSDGNSYGSPNRPNSPGDRSDSHHASSHRQHNPRKDHGSPEKSQSKHESGFASGDANRHHFGDAVWKGGNSNIGTSGQGRGAPTPHYLDDRYHSLNDMYQNGGFSTSISAPSGLAQSDMPYAIDQSHHQPPTLQSQPHQHHPQHAFQQHQFGRHHSHQPQHAQQHVGPYPHARHDSDHPSPGRWRDHAVPPSPAASSPHSSHSVSAPAKQHDSFAHGRNRPYSQNAPAPSRPYAHWNSQLGSERHNKDRMELSPSRRTDPSSTQGTQQQQKASSHYMGNNESNITQNSSSSQDHRNVSKGRVQRREASHQQRSSNRGNAYDLDAEEDYDDEQDELEDDADATREEHDYVLSNPLKLLAQASDAAAARIEGGRVEPCSRSSLAAVETMGLLHPTLPSNRMAVSAAVNLTGLGRPLYGRRDEDYGRNNCGWPNHSDRVLPPLLNAAPSDEMALNASSRAQPAFLKDSMRSISFPEGKLPRIVGPAPVNDSDQGGAALPLSASSQISAAKSSPGVPLGSHNILTPSTLDHEAWEYREGKAQARRGYGSGASPGGLSAEAGTTGSSVSVAAANGQKQDATSAGMNGASPGEMIESPADEVTSAMLGKRKRGRSRAARSGGLPTRRRKLAEWDTDAENGEAVDEDGMLEPSDKPKQVTIAAASQAKESSGVTSGGEGEAGASRKGYFNLSLFHSKNDDSEGLDPIELGLVELKELERLFDIFFARINPVLDLFDPFLHSVSFVRMRSAFLTTVISAMAARFSDTPHDAKLATMLDKHWQEKLLPTILLGGYKSVEISQAFLILTTYSRPTNRLVDDRSWQYLGFAIRTATEVGVNRKVTPSENLLGNEQVARRVRNRERLWFNLFLYDRTLSAQTGRPWTISEDRMIVQSSMWHRQDFALPEDVSLVSLIKLRRVTAQHTEAFDTYLTSPDRFDETQTATARGVGGQSTFDRRLAGLEFFRKNANADLEKWKETWCINTEDKIKEVDTSTAAGKYLVRWAPTAKLFYYHSRLLINSLVLGATEQYEGFLSGSSVSVDCWTSAISLIDTVLNDFTEEALVTWSNDRVVMAVYAAVSAVRMTNLQHKYAFADKGTLLALVRRLSTSMTNAGKTPRHRNGSATPYGRYLKSVLAAFEPENPATANAVQSGSAMNAQTPGKESEQATSITTSSLAPGDSRSAAATPPNVVTAAVETVAGDFQGRTQGASTDPADGKTAGDVDISQSQSQSGISKQAKGAFGAGGVAMMKAANGVTATDSSMVLKTEDLSSVEDVNKALSQVPLLAADGTDMDVDIAATASQLAAASDGDLQSHMEKLLDQTMRMDGSAVGTNSAAMLTPSSGGTVGSWPNPAALATNPIARPTSSSGGGGGGGAADLLTTPDSSMLLPTQLTSAEGISEGGSSGADAVATIPNVVDDPESLERMWDYMTAFEHTSFWQPQSTWNLTHNANNNNINNINNINNQGSASAGGGHHHHGNG
ncbi:uncharacterized protein MEPE_00843 [Melanopsichium pennsylvanicum]|uniref:Zn(2)-C6 fungal-type domain-containing protein n=2 Tax=Melanopsichium pennsylvanicum TaxID=63383 RepID=A0AAJ4XHF3_9BASI